MSNRIVLGFSGKKGAGKTTAAEHLRIRGFVHTSFATPIKDMLQTMLTYGQMNSLEIRNALYDPKWKGAGLAITGGKSVREMAQTLGTEWGRELITPDLWVRLWLGHVSLWPRANIVVDDVRFENEAEAIHNLGGKVIEIRRHVEEDEHSSHVSERGVKADFMIDNYSTPRDFELHLHYLVDNLQQMIIGRKEDV